MLQVRQLKIEADDENRKRDDQTGQDVTCLKERSHKPKRAPMTQARAIMHSSTAMRIIGAAKLSSNW